MARNVEGDDVQHNLNNGKRTPSTTRFQEQARSQMSPWFKSPYTPGRKFNKLMTPQSRRLIPKLRRASSSAEFDHGFEGLLKKQWRTYSLSPLFNFKCHRAALVKYARSLDAALSQAQSTSTDVLHSRPEKSDFSFYEDLKFGPDDPAALRIQVRERSPAGHGSKTVLEALLICVEPSVSPIPSPLQEHFTYYPVVLVTGKKPMTAVLLDWLERHFDCRSDPLTLSDGDLRYMLALCSAFLSGPRSPPVLLQYSLEGKCEGIKYIECKCEADHCKKLWERLLASLEYEVSVMGEYAVMPIDSDFVSEKLLFASPASKAEMVKDEVDTFVDQIETMLEFLMSISFKKLPLTEVGTSAAYVSHVGKIKLFSPSAVYTALHLLCEIANDRFMEMSPMEQ